MTFQPIINANLARSDTLTSYWLSFILRGDVFLLLAFSSLQVDFSWVNHFCVARLENLSLCSPRGCCFLLIGYPFEFPPYSNTLNYVECIVHWRLCAIDLTWVVAAWRILFPLPTCRMYLFIPLFFHGFNLKTHGFAFSNMPNTVWFFSGIVIAKAISYHFPPRNFD